MRAFKAVAGAALWLALMGASAAAQDAPANQFEVIELFNMGDNVVVRAFAQEPEKGTMWVGSSVGALEIDLATREARNTFTRKEGLANEYVFSVGIDTQGYKWFGTNAGGVARYRDGAWKVFFPMHGLADYWVYCFANDHDGALWIGTWAGANRVDLKTMKWTTFLDQLVNEWVYGLAVDSKNRKWFGTEGGVTMFDGKSWRSWTHKDGIGAPNETGLPPSPNAGLGTRSRHDLGVLSGGKPTYNPNYVLSIHVDAHDVVWAGTWGGGVSYYNGGVWRNYTTRDGLSGDIVYSIVPAPDGALWFGTDRGIARFDGKQWMTMSVHQGLLDNHVYALSVDPTGKVWVGTRKGVTIVALKAADGKTTRK